MDNPEKKTVTGMYYQVKEIPPLTSDLDNSLSFFNLIISSLTFHFEELYTFLTSNNSKLDILCISEARLELNKIGLTSISLPGYNTEDTTTEWSNGGILIYIKNYIKYKVRNVLQIYRSKELE